MYLLSFTRARHLCHIERQHLLGHPATAVVFGDTVKEAVVVLLFVTDFAVNLVFSFCAFRANFSA